MADCLTKIRMKVKCVFMLQAHMFYFKVVGSSSVSVLENRLQGDVMGSDFRPSNNKNPE